MKLKSLVLSFMILFMANVTADASQLPKMVKDYLTTQKKVPTVRFDGVVTYNNEVMYLPIYPSYPKEVEKLQIVKTYPENQTMDNLPDLVLFNNNFSLLKVVKNGQNNMTVRDILDGTFEFENENYMPFNINNKEVRCQKCNMTYQDFLDKGKFGCEECYKTFENKINQKPRHQQVN